MDINTILVGVVVSIVWFILGAILYMNPIAKKISDGFKDSPVMKKWKKPSDMMLNVYLFGCLIPAIMFALVYSVVAPALPADKAAKAIAFGLILIGVKIVPRYGDMATMTSYPDKLLALDLVNGSISSMAIGFMLAYML